MPEKFIDLSGLVESGVFGTEERREGEKHKHWYRGLSQGNVLEGPDLASRVSVCGCLCVLTRHLTAAL